MKTKLTLNVAFALAAVFFIAAVGCSKKEKEEAPISVIGVTLSDSLIWLAPSGTKTLTATVLPVNAANKTVTWTSSNSDVVKVTGSGAVVAMANGTATIAVVTADGEKAAACLVRVGTLVQSIALNKTTDTLRFGGNTEVALYATVLPNNAINAEVTWKSSNPEVATVGNTDYGYYEGRLVTAISEGTTIITVATVDGSKTATCTITVRTITYNSNPDGSLTLDGITWAASNVDDYQTFAVRPDMYTKFYQWNKTTAYSATNPLTPAWNSTANNTSATWTVNPCPAGWRLPTKAEFEELHSASFNGHYYAGTWAAANARGNAVAGRFFGPNHASCLLPDNMTGCVFLPAVGYRNSYGSLNGQGSYGYYWSATQLSTDIGQNLNFSSTSSSLSGNNLKETGLSVRCVK